MDRSVTPLSGFSPVLAFLLPLFGAAIQPMQAHATCPVDTPPQCGVSGDLGQGRWDLSAASGAVLRVEASDYRDPDWSAEYWFTGPGTLSLTRLGGADDNFIEVSCDGTVTGQGRDRIVGTISMDPVPADLQEFPYSCVDPDDVSNAPPNMVDSLLTRTLEVTYERSYTISGSVTDSGSVDLDYHFTSVTYEQGGDLATGVDGLCFFDPDEFDEGSEDITAAVPVEQVTLSGSYDALTGSWTPTITDRSTSWLADQLDTRIRSTVVNPDEAGDSAQAEIEPEPIPLSFIPDAPGAPQITGMTLSEPAYYLLAVGVTTQAEISINWRGQTPGTVEITYNGATATVLGSDNVIWPFAAGGPGTSITAVAVLNDERSLPYTLGVPKVAVPGWAGSSIDWTGSAGVRYDASLDWPSINVIESLASVPLLGGAWGLTPSSSTLNLVANSDGSAGGSTLSGEVGARLAGVNFGFPISGTSQTTLSCDALDMTGVAQFPSLETNWSDSFGIGDLVPGLESAACSASSILCGAVRGLSFMEAHASANLTGAGSFEGAGDAGAIAWTGGSITGNVEAGASLNIFPRVLQKVVNVGVSADGAACIELDVAPEVMVNMLGASLEAEATAAIFSQGVSASGEFSAGDDCSDLSLSAATAPDQGGLGGMKLAPAMVPSTFEVPGDGQVEVVLNPDSGAPVQAAAVWRALPAAGDRPGGSVSIRTYDDTGWSAVSTITNDAPADLAPAVAFDNNGNIIVVYQRNSDASAIPADISETEAFANGLELVSAVVDPATRAVIATTVLTDNDVADIGNSLHVDADGAVHLFWQRNEGTDFLGTVNPVQILHRQWNGVSWGAEMAAVSGLAGHYGWAPAVLNSNTALVAIVQDEDGDQSTAADRELQVAMRETGGWIPPMALTDDAIEDHSPIVGHLEDNTPMVLWVSGDQVVSLSGSLTGTPVAVTPVADTIGYDFNGAVIHLDSNVDVLWPDATELKALRRTGGGWQTPETLLSNNSSIAPLTVRRNGSDSLLYAQVEQEILSGGVLAATATVSIFNSDFADVVTVPGAPVIGQVVAGDGQAVVSFAAPTDDGGSAISGYIATSSPGSVTGACSGSPCTVAGLTNGVAYTFTVTAENSEGTSAPSFASNAVVPGGPATDSDGDGMPDSTDPFPFARTVLSDSGVALSVVPAQVLSTCSLDLSGFSSSAAYTEPPPIVATNAIGFSVAFSLSGCATGESVDVAIDFGVPLPSGAAAYKVDGPDWQRIAGAQVFGSTVRYTLTDNGVLDVDPAAGAIADPVSVAASSHAEAIPATPPAVLLLTAVFLLILGAFATCHRSIRSVKGV